MPSRLELIVLGIAVIVGFAIAFWIAYEFPWIIENGIPLPQA